MAGHIATATREDWATPPGIVAAVHVTFAGPPDLDPCSNATSIVQARRAIARPDDGLTADWSGARTIFVNPPFGKGLNLWTGRCVGAWRDHHASVLLLVPAAVDTGHWHEHVWKADAICFIRGRLRFVGARASAPFATAVALWVGPGGQERRELLHRFARSFGQLGVIAGSRGGEDRWRDSAL